MKEYDSFGQLLHRLMKEQSLSMRKLGELSDIHHATISRIINGKRKANLSHLEKLSKSLHIELTVLLEAAGYSVKHSKTVQEKTIDEDMTQHLFEIVKIYDNRITVSKLNEEISFYMKQSNTEGQKKKILASFQDKINKVDGKGPFIEKLKEMYKSFTQKNGTEKELMLMGAALLYFVVTTDIIPDVLFPIGYVDDALIVQMISQQMENKKSL